MKTEGLQEIYKMWFWCEWACLFHAC